MAANLSKIIANAGNEIIGPVTIADVMGGNEVNGGGSISIEANQGTQTLVAEVSPGVDSTGADMWVQVALTVPTAGVEAAAASITGAATVQYGRFELVGVIKVRARVTAAGNGKNTLARLVIKGS